MYPGCILRVVVLRIAGSATRKLNIAIDDGTEQVRIALILEASKSCQLRVPKIIGFLCPRVLGLT